tara:strand:+ start:212 stop:439 length:228 start_codon:yes stop_codon:yes gene_type:complete
MDYYTVEGHGDLARDPTTNAIVNVNRTDYNQYIERRSVKSKENQKVQTIEEEVANIKGELDEIKFLLKEIINGSR